MRWLWLPLVCSLVLSAEAVDVPPVRLGLVVPTAGDAGPVAQSMRRAAEMAVSDWGPKLARRIELSVKDDAFDPRQAAATAEQLVQEGVWGVVGHFYSSSSLPASVVYHEAGVPQVTPTATHPRLTAQGFDNVLRVSGRDDQQALVAAEFVVLRVKARRVAVVHDRTEYGRGLVETFRRELARRGARPVVAEESLAQGDRDFAAQVARLREARPDVVYFGGVFREAGYLIRQCRQAGVQAAFVSGDAVLDPEFVALAGEEAAAGAYLTFAPDPRLVDSARPLIQQYESRYGSLGPHVLSTYDAVGVLLRAIQAAKPADSSKEELGKVVRAIRAGPYYGALGVLRWDKNGDRTPAPYAVYVTKRGGSVQGWFEQLPRAAPAGAEAKPQPR
jgi:branched-chain amino acid transport system substrate-binding protein